MHGTGSQQGIVATGGNHADAGFRHGALVYADDQEFLDGTLPFVQAGVEREDPVMVAVDEPKARLLREHLGRAASRVDFRDMRAVGGNPGAIISVWRDFAAAHEQDGRRLWGIGEPVWVGRSPAELGECHRHECLLNLAFADAHDFRLLCPYDAALPASVLEDVHVSHPEVTRDGAASHSDRYGVDGPVAALFAEPLPAPPGDVVELVFQTDDLGTLRSIVVDGARAAGLSEQRVEDAVLAVNELAANSVSHGGGAGTLRHWREGDAAYFEVIDPGRIIDPLVGRQRPPRHGWGGFGLWIVNQVCDLVQVRSSEGGTVIRLTFRAG